MTRSPSLFMRIAAAKATGFAIGVLGFVLIPVLAPGIDPMLPWGILFWYTTMGAVIGVFGIYTQHPVLNLPLPWWLRAPLLGAWMNFVLVFFAHPVMREFLETLLGPDSGFTSPFWFVLEGAIVGAIIGAVATHIGGEGRETLDDSVV